MTETELPRTQNLRGEGGRLRQDLLRAALQLVDAGGFGSLTLRGVSRGAGVSAPAVYRHFTDLQDLMAAVVARCFQELIEQICMARDGADDARARLLASAEGYLRYAETFPGRYAVLFGRASAPGGPDAAPVYDPTGASERAFTILVDAVTDCLHAAEISAGPATEIAITIWVGLDGFANLRAQRPHFPWPPPDTLLQRLVLDHVPPAPASGADRA